MKIIQSVFRFWKLLFILSPGLWFVSPSTGSAQNPPAARPDNLQWVTNTYLGDLARAGSNSDWFVRPGLLASRTGHWVRILAEATGLKPPTPTEFFLISQASGHDYESLAVSFAQPSDIHAALEFIGLPAGRPVDSATTRLWPCGERVLMFFQWKGSNGIPTRVRAEDLFIDIRTSKPLPARGLVFTGSRWITPADRPDMRLYAADANDPNSIAANFNHPDTVLDVPCLANQNEIYGSIVPNQAYPLSPGHPVEVILKPEHPDGQRRVALLTLDIARDSSALEGTPPLAFSLTSGGTNAIVSKGTLPALLAALGRMTDAQQDPFITLRFADNLTLGEIVPAARFVASIENEKGIRVDSPPPGHPYYKSFLPTESYRLRDNRPSQPWELTLHPSPTNNHLGTLVHIEEEWLEDSDKIVLKPTSFPVRSLADLTQTLVRTGAPRVVFIFAPATTPFVQLRGVAAVILKTHPTVYFFILSPEKL